MDNKRLPLPDNKIAITKNDTYFIYHNTYHPIYWLAGNPYRPRVEMLIIKDGREVFLRKYEKSEEYQYCYRIPSGSVDSDSDRLSQAINEVNEEALLTVTNAYYGGVQYIEEYPPDFLLKKGDICIQYKGTINDVFICEYKGKQDKKKIDKHDLDNDMAKYGEFYSIILNMNIMKPYHLQALLNNNIVCENVKRSIRLYLDKFSLDNKIRKKEYLYMIDINYTSTSDTGTKKNSKLAYSYSGVALNAELSPIYTFRQENINLNPYCYNNGFTLDTIPSLLEIDKNCYVYIKKIAIPSNVLSAIKERFRYMIEQAHTSKYNFIELFSVAFGIKLEEKQNITGKQLCSEFVNRIFNQVTLSSSLFYKTPDDLMIFPNRDPNKIVEEHYEGLLKDYIPKIVEALNLDVPQNAEVFYKKGKLSFVQSEYIVLNKDKIYLEEYKNGNYKLPSSINNLDQKFLCESFGMNTGDLVLKNSYILEGNYIDSENQVYVTKYNFYLDKDKFSKNGKFYPLYEIYNDLLDYHKEAIKDDYFVKKIVETNQEFQVMIEQSCYIPNILDIPIMTENEVLNFLSCTVCYENDNFIKDIVRTTLWTYITTTEIDICVGLTSLVLLLENNNLLSEMLSLLSSIWILLLKQKTWNIIENDLKNHIFFLKDNIKEESIYLKKYFEFINYLIDNNGYIKIETIDIYKNKKMHPIQEASKKNKENESSDYTEEIEESEDDTEDIEENNASEDSTEENSEDYTEDVEENNTSEDIEEDSEDYTEDVEEDSKEESGEIDEEDLDDNSDYTEDMDEEDLGANEEGNNDGEEEQSDEDIETTDTDEENNDLKNNYNLLTDFSFLYDQVSSIRSSLDSLTYPDSVQNQAVSRLIKNLCDLQDSISHFIQYEYGEDYRSNLYSYQKFIMILQQYCFMLEKISSLSTDKNKKPITITNK